MADVGTLRARSEAAALSPRALIGAFSATQAVVVLVPILIFAMALLPRVIALHAYLTTDEGNWMGRTALFTQALQNGDPWGTYQSGHPGVTTMWTTLIGMGPERALGLVEYVRPDGLEKAPNYLETLRLARRGFPVITSLAVVVLALLTWRLFGPGPGILAGVLLGLEPFFLAHSVVAHLDGTLTAYMSVAALSGLVYWWSGRGVGYLILCGVSTGLAFLTKAPAAFLAVFIPLIALSSCLREGRPNGLSMRRLIGSLVVWGGLAGLMALVLWPAFRADPVWALRSMISYTEAVGGTDHENFFFGQPVGDPGPIYYLVAAAFRLTPVTMVGLALLPIGLVLARPWRREYLAPIGLLALFVLLFWGMMALPPKKFDRYMLPAFPALEILAALGFWLALTRVSVRLRAAALAGLVLIVGAAQILPAALVYPYYLSYYNPLLGGGAGARRSIVVGWGEGLDAVADYLNSKPEAERLTLSGFYPRVLMAQFKGTVLPDKQFDPAQADYLVLYVNAVQRDLADRLRSVARGRRSEMTVRINGIEYARLVRVPPPPGRSAAGTEFGSALRIERYYMKSEERRYLKSDELHAGDILEFTLRWRLLQPLDPDLRLTLEVVDARGRVSSDIDGPVLNAFAVSAAPEVGQETIGMHKIPLPDAPGEYWVALGIRDAAGARVPVSAWPERLSADSRRLGDRVLLENLDVR